ncbi:MAG: hypothetical protein K9G76_09515 [Bacteroidales bacterium]|nr:hypothetical protein [Bacteroidales bacterium]MCF8403936.1 hypothetical protein [Bacteroidales bacterium]
MKETIFDNIITNENSFTELFKSFLRFKFLRQSFLRLIGIELDLESIKYEDFDAQYSIPNYGRPDLGLIYENVEILFEIKVYNTTLTENQPKGYYTYLSKISKAKIKGLILIIPEDYYNLGYYNECLQSIKKEEDNIFTQIISWESILKIITGNEINEISPLFSEYSVFIDKWFNISSIFYDNLNITTMFGKHFPESLKRTTNIIDNVYNEFKKRDYNLKWSSDRYFSEYGFYFNLLDEDDKLFFGIWFDYWLNYGNPVCIALESDNSKTISSFHKGIKLAKQHPTTNYDKWHVTFIDQFTLMDNDCETLIRNILTEILSSLDVISLETRNI